MGRKKTHSNRILLLSGNKKLHRDYTQIAGEKKIRASSVPFIKEQKLV